MDVKASVYVVIYPSETWKNGLADLGVINFLILRDPKITVSKALFPSISFMTEITMFVTGGEINVSRTGSLIKILCELYCQ